MKEVLWSCLLLAPLCFAETRPLALLTAIKFCLIYSLYQVAPHAPAVIDVLVFPLVFALIRLKPSRWSLSYGFLYTAGLFAHGVHWSLWSNGIYVGNEYYAIMLWLFTALIVSLYGGGGIVEFFRSAFRAPVSVFSNRSFVGHRKIEDPDWGIQAQNRLRGLVDVRSGSLLHLSSKKV